MSDARARAEQAGGWGALAAGVLSVAITAVVLAGLVGERGARPDLRLLLAVLSLLTGVAQGAAALALHRNLRPSSWVTRFGLGGALAGAGLWLLSGAAGLLAAGQPARAGVLAELAPVGTGIWALCVSAAAWKAKSFPRWLRVAGTVFGACAMIQPGFPPAALLALLAGLPWWWGLGAQLLHASRSTAG